ncbi:hypothetical protein GW17_00008689 [Ensete ventricosum]|nr:hypothetical protein GW17_00008689 [Ensete ventricosum]
MVERGRFMDSRNIYLRLTPLHEIDAFSYTKFLMELGVRSNHFDDQAGRPVAFGLPPCQSPVGRGGIGWSARCACSTLSSANYRQGCRHATDRPLSGTLRIDRDRMPARVGRDFGPLLLTLPRSSRRPSCT